MAETIGDSGPTNDEGLWGKAFRRRVPHAVGAYIAATAGVVQFVDWAVDRYLLSPNLTDFALIALALLVPTVIMLAWRHGQPGRNRWTRLERIGVPANVVVATGVLVAVFAGQSFGSIVTTVTVADEGGNDVERVVPKTEFRRHIALFYFDNETGDAEHDWLQFGIPRGLWADWRQDFFLGVLEGTALAESFREANRPDGLDLPLALKREIADEKSSQFFLTGEIRNGEVGIEVATALFEVQGGQPIAERSYTGPLFDIIDQISADVREDLGIPSGRLAETTDLPLGELLTESEPAYRDYVAAFRALAVEGDYVGAGASVAAAVEKDPSFALAHWLRYAIASFSGESATAAEALTAAKQHEYRLPERERLYVTREFHYTLRQDAAKGVAMAERSVQMFPDDIEALTVLGIYYQAAGRVDDAIGVYQQMLTVDPSQSEPLLAIGQLHGRQGDHEAALENLSRYAELSPQDLRTYPMLASAYRGTGQFAAAGEACDRALLIEPENVAALTCLANVSYELGRWPESERYFEDALAAARTPATRAQVHQARGGYFSRRGQISDAVMERRHELAALAESGASPIEVLARRMRTLVPFVYSTRPATALDSAAAISALFPQQFENLSAVGEIDIYAALEDPEGLDAASARVELAIASLGIEALRPNVIMAGALARELRGDCEGAIPEYRRALELAPTATAWKRFVARCLAQLGRTEEAVTELEEALAYAPFGPRTLLELSKVEVQRGNPEGAVTHLERALSVWSDADASYQPAIEARELRASLSTN